MQTKVKSELLVSIILPLSIGLCLRCATMLHPYSGAGSPPMFGDYEAQRHWMEITVNLPAHNWYFNSTENDLNYWGLDYPPLTAYHSYLLGIIAQNVNASWVELHASRGLETAEHKLFMRYTVLLSELLTYTPAVIYFVCTAVRHLTVTPCLSQGVLSLLMFSYPGLILIDHGHFQYNCVSLGLFLLAFGFFCDDHNVFGTIAFCLALAYKQMELYHALPFFGFLLGHCLRQPPRRAVFQFVCLAFTVCTSFILVLLPFLSSNEQLAQLGFRLFPLARGLFEDKVANFWCISSLAIKWRTLLATNTLLVACTFLTLFASLPACANLLWRPTKPRLAYAQVVVSLAFFLFSYQVHEKSILLCAVPALCLFPLTPVAAFYFCMVSTLSLWPLLLKDGLAHACVVLSVCFYALGFAFVHFNPSGRDPLALPAFWPLNMSMAIYFGLFVLQVIVSPPISYPFIFPLAVNAVSFGHFVGFFCFWYWCLFRLPKSL
ncbi:unnamed protein product [Schistocephalus solidus]|uniref:Alpha-1,3-glucosyltransferase n=2 Tax=Schistocephalus solidus TaxID=70667 RepID=A0A183T6J6_SCHSO|nr:unnamed protein product [Schistocephalus solidus]